MSFWDGVGKVFGALGDSATGGLFSLGTSLISGLAGNKSVKNQNEANYQIAQANNQTQMDIANQNNETQVAMQRENNQFNRDMALEMFNLENSYNSPLAQVARLQQAGINPAVYFANGGGSAGTASASVPQAAASGVTPSLPSMVTPHMEAAPSIVAGSIQSLSQLAETFAKSAGAEYNKAQAKSILEKLQPELDKIFSEKAYADAQKAYLDLQSQFDKLSMDARVASVAQKLKNLTAEYTLAVNQGELAKAQKLYNDAQAALTHTENENLKAQAPVLLENLKKTGQLIVEQQKTEKAKQAEGYASASEHQAGAREKNERASQLEEMHDDLVALQKAETREGIMRAGQMARTYETVIQKMVNEKEITEWQAAEAEKKLALVEEQLKLAQKENSSYYYRIALGTFTDLVRSGATVYGLKFLGGAKAKPVKGFSQ